MKEDQPSKVGTIQVPRKVFRLDPHYDGFIFISDIDKTYLATQIDSLGGLLRAAFESPEKKLNVPGFSILLRAVRRGAGPVAIKNPLFFVSASPPQMERKLLAKMEMDGVEHDGIVFKDQLQHVRKANFKKLREQLGYKLGALLSLWIHLPKKSKLVLFGDDSESDALVFSLFSEVVAGQVRGNSLLNLLSHLKVFREEAVKVAWLSRKIKEQSFPVRAAFINLETGSMASYYARLGAWIYATDNTLQTAVALFEQGLIREQAVRSIGRNLVLQYDFDPEKLLQTLEAGARRGIFGLDTLDRLWPMLYQANVLPSPLARPANEGALTRLNPERWNYSYTASTLMGLKRRYSEEGRY